MTNHAYIRYLDIEVYFWRSDLYTDFNVLIISSAIAGKTGNSSRLQAYLDTKHNRLQIYRDQDVYNPSTTSTNDSLSIEGD